MSGPMEAGRKIDARVAEMMGERVCDYLEREAAGTLPCNLYCTPHYHPGDRQTEGARYSTDMAATWELADWLTMHGHVVTLRSESGGEQWWAEVAWDTPAGSHFTSESRASTASLALCIAALNATPDVSPRSPLEETR